MTGNLKGSAIPKTTYNRIYYSKCYHVFLYLFFAFCFLSIVFLGLSVVFSDSQSKYTIATAKTCSDNSLLITGLSNYTDVIITVIIAIGIALLTIDATVFIFSKSALDRFHDENRYIASIVKIHKEKTINLLFINCIFSALALLLPLCWHFGLSFERYFNGILFAIGLAFLAANSFVYVLLSYNFLRKCIRIEAYLRDIIKTNFDEYARIINNKMPPEQRDDELKIIGDWYTWQDWDYVKEAKKLCEETTRDQFINIFQKAEKLLIPDESRDEASVRKVKIVTIFQERKSIFEAIQSVEKNDLDKRTYFRGSENTQSVLECIREFESKVGFSQSSKRIQEEFFTDTIDIYSILKEYCNLLISERFTEPVSTKRKNNMPLSEEEMYLPVFTMAFYSFYIRILSVFVSSVSISDYSFNNSSLNYANFYNSNLGNITLFCATFYRTIFSRTSFQRVIMDMSMFEDIDFYSSTLLDSSMNNSDLTQVRFERANVKTGGFDACSFTRCKFIDSDFSDCNFNNTEYEDTEFIGANFINSKFRDISVKGGCFDSCSFEGSELSKWDIEGDMSLVSCDFSKSTWSEMAINNWDLSESVFSKAILAGTVFNYATMNSADFSDCSLAETEIEKSKMAGCNLKRASLFKAKLTEVDLSMADLSNANAVQAKFLYKCSLENTNCDDADFSGAEFDDAVLNSARLYNCSFTNSKLNQTKCLYLLADKMQFTFAECNDCDFSYSSLSNSNLTKSSFSSCKFIGADLSSTNETETKFENCILKNTDFSDTRFVNAEFFGESPDHPMIIVNCDFTDCKFESVSFRNVIFVNCIFNDCVMIKCKNTDGNFITKCNAEGLFGSDSRSITFFNKELIIDEDSDSLNKKNKRLIETNRKRSARHNHHRIHRNR